MKDVFDGCTITVPLRVALDAGLIGYLEKSQVPAADFELGGPVPSTSPVPRPVKGMKFEEWQPGWKRWEEREFTADVAADGETRHTDGKGGTSTGYFSPDPLASGECLGWWAVAWKLGHVRLVKEAPKDKFFVRSEEIHAAARIVAGMINHYGGDTAYAEKFLRKLIQDGIDKMPTRSMQSGGFLVRFERSEMQPDEVDVRVFVAAFGAGERKLWEPA